MFPLAVARVRRLPGASAAHLALHAGDELLVRHALPVLLERTCAVLQVDLGKHNKCFLDFSFRVLRMLQEGFGGGARAVGRGRARGGGRGQRLTGEGAVEKMVADAAQRDRERSDAVHLASSARVTCTETHG